MVQSCAPSFMVGVQQARPGSDTIAATQQLYNIYHPDIHLLSWLREAVATNVPVEPKVLTWRCSGVFKNNFVSGAMSNGKGEVQTAQTASPIKGFV